MTYKFITDRFEVLKLSFDACISDDEMIVNMDYADLCKLRQMSALKYAIVCKVCDSENGFVQEILHVIKSEDIPLTELRSCLVNFRIKSSESFLKLNDLSKLLEQLYEIRPEECRRTDPYGLYRQFTVHANSEIPEGVCYIDIVLGVDKTEEDKEEDKIEEEKLERMVEEYRNSKLSPTEDSSPIEKVF